jgi:hypothetical protein
VPAARLQPANSGTIQPEHGGRKFTGKVEGSFTIGSAIFEGFLLRTEASPEHAFRATEAEIAALVRFAWSDRMVTSVQVHEDDPEHPISINPAPNAAPEAVMAVSAAALRSACSLICAHG